MDISTYASKTTLRRRLIEKTLKALQKAQRWERYCSVVLWKRREMEDCIGWAIQGTFYILTFTVFNNGSTKCNFFKTRNPCSWLKFDKQGDESRDVLGISGTWQETDPKGAMYQAKVTIQDYNLLCNNKKCIKWRTRLESLAIDGCGVNSRVAQRKRAGPITQRSEDRNLPLLHKL